LNGYSTNKPIEKETMSPRSSISNKKIRDERCDQILHSALKVFAYKGFRGTKISDIAAQAAISQGLVHHYFASKEKVYVAVVERALHGALAALEESSDPHATPWEQLLRITERLLDGMRIHPQYMLVIIQSLASQDVPPQTGRLLANLGRQFNARLVEIIQAGQAVGEVARGDPQELASIFTAAIQGIAITQFTGGFFTRIEPIADKPFLPAPEMVLRILKA
jgi:AcrR family transcriptional regulator